MLTEGGREAEQLGLCLNRSTRARQSALFRVLASCSAAQKVTGKYPVPHIVQYLVPIMHRVIANLCACVSPSVSVPSPDSQQLDFLEGRRKQYMKAALQAKQQKDMEQAKGFLRTAKALEPLIEAARLGKAVDISKVAACFWGALCTRLSAQCFILQCNCVPGAVAPW